MTINFDLTTLFSGSVSPVLFLDFDGTVSKIDVIDAILEEFADPSWLEIEQEWIDGRIGSRECLRRQFELVRVTPLELDVFLAGFDLDEGTLSLLDLCRKIAIPVHIASDGFTYYIDRMLRKAINDPAAIANVGVWANELIPTGKDRWRTNFPHLPNVCGDGCATCKPAVMKMNNRTGAPTVFIGDGLSDRFAAKSADVVFAKEKLVDFCGKNDILYHHYDNLQQISDSLRSAYESVTSHESDGLGFLEPSLVQV